MSLRNNFKLKLAIISALMDDGHFVAEAKRIKAKHGKKAKDYKPIKEVIAFYRTIELTPKQLASITTLSPDGGDLAYVHAMNVWDGEDGQFDIESLAGIEALVNLEELTPISMMSENGVDYSAIAGCPKLKKVDMTFAKAGKKSDALAVKLEARGVEVET